MSNQLPHLTCHTDHYMTGCNAVVPWLLHVLVVFLGLQQECLSDECFPSEFVQSIRD
jgi:hypothetical protein